MILAILSDKFLSLSLHYFSRQLMDGRKSVGGKLEVKLKLRDPLKNKQVEEVKEKWLIIDKFLQKVSFLFIVLI